MHHPHMSGARNPHCYDAFGLGMMDMTPDQMVTYSTVASAAVSGYHGYMSGGMQGAAIWGGAGAVVPQVFHRVAGMFMEPGVVTALIGCSIVPALAVSRGFARPSMGMGMGMF